jgi:integrase
MSEVWAQWERYQERPVDTLGWLLDQYQASREFHWRSNNKPKSADHIKEQQRYATNLKAYLLKGGRRFGDVDLKSLTPGVIRKYLDQRLKDGARVAGNREKALISTAWNWALERDKTNIPNPCPKVKRNAEESRKHYAADDDYVTFLEFVKEGPYSYIWIVCEIAYLCRMRKIEVLSATKSQVLREGFDTLRRKGSRDAITSWSPRLRAAIDAALALPLVKGVSTNYLIHNKYGQPIKVNSFNTGWQRRMRACIREKGIARFTLHDLKRKGATDSDLPATISTGNTSAAAKVYDIKKLKASPTK